MNRKARNFFIGMLLLLLGISAAACGEEEYVVEYGVDGYVYQPQKLNSMKNIKELNVFGNYLYLTEDGGNRIFIERLPISSMLSDEGRLSFSQKKEILTVPFTPYVLPEGVQEALEDFDFSDLVKGKGLKGWNPAEEERVYCLLSLTGLAADQEQNLYYTLGLTTGTIEEMEVGGGLLCRQTAEGELSYWKYLPEIKDMAVDTEGRACVLTGREILVLDEDGHQVKSVSVEAYQNDDSGNLEELFMDSEGRVFYCIRGKNYVWKSFELVDKDGLQLQDAGGFLGSDTYHTAALEGNILLYSQSSLGHLYKYNRETGMTKELLSWSHSGMSGYDVYSVAEITPEILLVCYGDVMDNCLYQLTKTSTDELPEREMLVLASFSNYSEMQDAVASFNASSDKYRIVIGDYKETTLDAALMSSNPPDLIDLTLLDISKYAGQGALEDLSPYLESSSELNRADYLDNMLEGMTLDGRLVCIPSRFKISSITGRTSQVRILEGWSMEDVYKLTDGHPESKAGLINDGFNTLEEREYFLKVFCSYYYLEKFVDWEKSECNFDCEEFRRLLAWIGEYAWEPESKVEQVGPVFRDQEYVPETALLVSQYWLFFKSLMWLEIQCGEEITLMGLPTVSGKGIFPAEVEGALAIYVNSPHKEGAWEFIEYYLSSKKIPDYERIADGSFPTRKELIQREYENEITQTYKNGSDGELKVKGQVWVGTDLFPYYSIPKEQADVILHVIETADFSPMTTAETMIINIVMEEAESYYNGDKSLEEVTGIIQNRAQLLLQERKK